jgi:hypothetical protein
MKSRESVRDIGFNMLFDELFQGNIGEEHADDLNLATRDQMDTAPTSSSPSSPNEFIYDYEKGYENDKPFDPNEDTSSYGSKQVQPLSLQCPALPNNPLRTRAQNLSNYSTNFFEPLNFRKLQNPDELSHNELQYFFDQAARLYSNDQQPKPQPLNFHQTKWKQPQPSIRGNSHLKNKSLNWRDCQSLLLVNANKTKEKIEDNVCICDLSPKAKITVHGKKISVKNFLKRDYLDPNSGQPLTFTQRERIVISNGIPTYNGQETFWRSGYKLSNDLRSPGMPNSRN